MLKIGLWLSCEATKSSVWMVEIGAVISVRLWCSEHIHTTPLYDTLKRSKALKSNVITIVPKCLPNIHLTLTTTLIICLSLACALGHLALFKWSNLVTMHNCKWTHTYTFQYAPHVLTSNSISMLSTRNCTKKQRNNRESCKLPKQNSFGVYAVELHKSSVSQHNLTFINRVSRTGVST